MFYEKHVTSLKGLMKEAGTMDPDAGMRLRGRYGGEGCYCFVTKFGEVFTVMVYARPAGRKSAPGRLLASFELKSAGRLEKLFRQVCGPKVDAYVY